MVGSEKTAKKTFLSGFLLLSLSTVLVKAVGLLYKIPMLSYLGSVGMGYFNSAYEIYALFSVIATAGLPVALSVLISAAIAEENGAKVKRIYRTATAAFLIIGVVGSLLMVGFASAFCDLIQSQNAYFSILAISPTVFFVCVSSALRGYFQGYQRMLPTAVSQLIEAVGKLVFGLLLARQAFEAGREPPVVAAAAGVGLTLGTLASTLYLLVEKLRFSEGRTMERKGETEGGTCAIGRDLARLAIPVTVGASAVSLTKLVDVTMILRRLQAIGYSEVLANELYGSYTTLALSVFGLIPSLVNSVALPLVPLLSAAIAAGDREKQSHLIRSSYQLTAFFSIPSALGIAAFARPVLSLLFANEPEAVAVAAPLLSVLGASVFLSCMITATNSVLHAYRAVVSPVLSMLAGTALKILSAYLLIGNPSVGMLGAPISTFLCDAAVVAVNLCFAQRRCRTNGIITAFLRPLAASFCAVGVAYGGYLLLASRFGERVWLTLAALGTAALLYLVFACLMRAIQAEDLLALPMGKKLLDLLVRLGLMKNETEKKGSWNERTERSQNSA